MNIRIIIDTCEKKKVFNCRRIKAKIKKQNANEELRPSLKKFFKSLAKHKGILAWLCPLIITFAAAFLRFLWFAVESGRVLFWNIDLSAISMSSNSIYNIVLFLVFSIIILAIMMIPTIIIQSKQKTLVKIFDFFVLYMLFFVICAVYVDGWTALGENLIMSTITFSISVALVFGFVLLPGFLLCWAIGFKRKSSRPIKLTPKWLIISIVAWAILIIGFSFYIGYDSASSQTRFRITKDDYAIIYENDDYYYMAKYDPVKNEINREQQKAVLKNEIEYIWKSDLGEF